MMCDTHRVNTISFQLGIFKVENKLPHFGGDKMIKFHFGECVGF